MHALARWWDAMVAALRAHPRVTVTHTLRRPPATDDARRAVRAILGDPLPDDIADYLDAANGLELSWEAGGEIVGAVHIPPLETVADPRTWLCPIDIFEDRGDAYGVPLEPNVLPFDFVMWSDMDIDIAGLIRREGRWDVFVSEDNVADPGSSYLATFGDYLDLLMRAYGSSYVRTALCQGHSNDRGLRARDVVPGLFDRTWRLDALIELHVQGPTIEAARRFFQGPAPIRQRR